MRPNGDPYGPPDWTSTHHDRASGAALAMLLMALAVLGGLLILFALVGVAMVGPAGSGPAT